MINRVFLDLDGTLVDSRVRQYELFTEIIHARSLSVEDYWIEKRNGVRQRDMLLKYASYSDEQILVFNERWMAEIEDTHRMLADKLIFGALEFLVEASSHYQLFLVTGRQHHDRLVDQMQRLKIRHYFSKVLNTAQRVTKTQLVRSNFELRNGDVFIGDTNEDILTGKELGMYTIGVTSGASSKKILMKYNPNMIVDSVKGLILKKLGNN